jgi:hypothetical protein
MEYLHYHKNISKPSNLSIINDKIALFCKYLYICIYYLYLKIHTIYIFYQYLNVILNFYLDLMHKRKWQDLLANIYLFKKIYLY